MQAVTFVHYGHRGHQNSATPMIVEYMERRALAKLGFTSPLGEARPFVVECFLAIESEFNRLRAHDAAAKRREP